MHLKTITSFAVLLLAISAAHSEKKIELQDIEADTLYNEKQLTSDDTLVPSDQPHSTESELESSKRAHGRPMFLSPTPPLELAPYIHQYSVDEPLEKPNSLTSSYTIPATSQQAMIGYLSNIPMHIYLIPHGYGRQTHGMVNFHSAVAANPGITSVTANYVEAPTYLVPSGTGMQQYSPQVTYVTYNHPTAGGSANPHMSVLSEPSNPSQSFLSYQVPTPRFSNSMIHYASQNVADNKINESPDNKKEEEPKDFHTDGSDEDRSELSQYRLRTQAPPRKTYSSIATLPAPNPIIFKGSPYTVPKTLPYTRPTPVPVYGSIKYFSDSDKPKHPGAFQYLRHHPNSLLDSYIPSKVQIDYMKRGFTKDPLSAYEALSSSLYQYSNSDTPQRYQRGFRPNQMYQTAAGGITYGTVKKSANKIAHK